ncbi:MAG: EAL domain-containing protein [Alcanivoracaceae bacterium]|nr:EAL domain-containing protein [Alcanivoracaceae bacterium]
MLSLKLTESALMEEFATSLERLTRLRMKGHELDMQVVAEAVQDKKNLELLKDMDCDSVQGYYIERLMPAKNLIPWIQHKLFFINLLVQFELLWHQKYD